MNFEDGLVERLSVSVRETHADVPELVAGGIRRGRRNVRIRALTRTLVAGIACTLIGGFVVSVLPPDTRRGGEFGEEVASPRSGTPTATPIETATITPQAALQIVLHQMPVGAKTEGYRGGYLHGKPTINDDLNVYAEMTYVDQEGSSYVSVNVGMIPDNRPCPVGNGPGDCHRTRLSDGSVLTLRQDRSHDSGLMQRSASLVHPNGLSIYLVEDNSRTGKGPISRPEPALTLRQLEAIVTSPRWKEQVSADLVNRAEPLFQPSSARGAGAASRVAVEAKTTAQLRWEESPTDETAGILYSTDAQAGAMWSVGLAESGPRNDDWSPLALRRDGSHWSSTPQPVASGRLNDVAVRSGTDVWAVGEEYTDTLGQKPVIQRWDGARWQIIDAPPLPAGVRGGLNTVATTGGTEEEVWTAGQEVDADGSARQVVYTHSNNTWRSIADSAISNNTWIYDLAPITDRDVWVAMDPGIAHFDGRRWTRQDLPGDDSAMLLQSLVAAGPNDIWAVGHRRDPVLWRRPLVLHFDGTKWSEAPTPADSAQLNAVTLIEGRPIATGEDLNTSEAYVLRSNGNRFVAEEAPSNTSSLSSADADRERLWVAGSRWRTGSTPDKPVIATTKN
ncbi:hypothetical protein [Flindersiella endophytica]